MSDDDFDLAAVSALIDGESDAAESAETLRKLGRDARLKAYWERQHLAREALHAELSPALDTGFAARVAAAVEAEPAILAPQSRPVEPVAPAASGAPSGSVGYRRPLAGLAIAATVAAVSIAALQLFDGGASPGVPRLAGQSAGQPAATTINVTGSSAAQLVSTPGTHWSAPSQTPRDRELEQRLNMYLSDHLEHATIGKVHGMLPYSRLVGYDTAQ